MAFKIKREIALNLYEALRNKYYNGRYDELIKHFTLMPRSEKTITWKVSIPKINDTSLPVVFKDSQQKLFESGVVTNLSLENLQSVNLVSFDIDVKNLIKDVLNSDPTELIYKPKKKKIVMEFSSPNMAKPFHVGHIRSTLIGNYLGNLKKKLGNDVIKLNYLGDWGTQVGKLQIGVNLLNLTEENLQENPLKLLFKAYVLGEKECKKSDESYNKAKQIFADLESGKEYIVKAWEKYRHWTWQELSQTYNRLGVSFDHVSWESETINKNLDYVLEKLEDKGVLLEDESKRKIVKIGDVEIPIVKSDSSSLYILRDLIAVIDRKEKFNFDEMYYVVDNGQTFHFQNLFSLCDLLEITKNAKLNHVKFGKIQGMSTREGKVVFLQNVLDEARENAREGQIKSTNTKTTDPAVTDILGVSAVIINDLKRQRKKDYNFVWSEISKVTKDSGVFLQYIRCRLRSLEKVTGVKPAEDCDPDALLESQALDLVVAIAKYEESLLNSDESLESCVFVEYLFDLARKASLALKFLRVKEEDSHLASQRMLLFYKTRKVLDEGMLLLGLKLLDEM